MAVGVIDVRARGDHAHASALAHEPQGFPRRAHADLHLGTDADPLDVLPEDLHEELVALVPAVEADLFAEQAGRDPNLQFQRSPFN